MSEYFKKIFDGTHGVKKIAGIVLVILGPIIHIIPLVPAGWIIFIGLELLGVRLLFWEKIVVWFRRN